ncbi:hypothetical protein [Prevotella falsenii]|uniref:hypothetical protein n=1 Tax=Prevotella falsenii TaxID=515414 RepID=UPI0018DE8737|nr:hypothetical protein [Prevotella falsenii]
MLTMPMQSLLNLPDSAVFRRQSGRLLLEAYHKGGNVYIRGSTLPIEREVRQTTVMAKHDGTAQENKAAHRASKVSKTVVKKPPSVLQDFLILIGVSVLLSAIALAGIKYSFRIKK